MKTGRGLRTGWWGRTLRGRRFDRNPLRRGTDRAETIVVLVLLAAFGCGAWFGAHATASWTAGRSLAEMHAQRTAFRQIRAVLLDQPMPGMGFRVSLSPRAEARWTAPDGSEHTGVVAAPLSALPGSTVLTWVNQSGDQVSPLGPDQAALRSDAVAVATAGVAAGIAALLRLLAHRVFDRRRLAAWEADWSVTGPRWTSRR
jgi:hypothetical protein